MGLFWVSMMDAGGWKSIFTISLIIGGGRTGKKERNHICQKKHKETAQRSFVTDDSESRLLRRSPSLFPREVVNLQCRTKNSLRELTHSQGKGNSPRDEKVTICWMR